VSSNYCWPAALRNFREKQLIGRGVTRTGNVSQTGYTNGFKVMSTDQSAKYPSDRGPDADPVTPATEHLTAGRPTFDSFSAGTTVSQRFRIRQFLGRGGMGEVYAADDLDLGGIVALKTIHPDLIDSRETAARFRREIQLARQVTHPNICRVFDLGRTEFGGREILYFTMEYLPGVTLSRYLKDGNKPGPGEAFALIEQLADGLQALHARGILHRDLKPGNIMLVESEGKPARLVIGDFGLARDDSEDLDQLTRTRALMGTPAYMAPEQLLGERASPASDIYAFGMLVFEIATGKVIADGTTLKSRLSADVVLPEHDPLPPGWEQLIRRCMARDPADRPASAPAALAGLRASAPVAKPSRPSKALIAAGAALLFVGLGALAVRQFHAPETVPLAVAAPANIDDLLLNYYAPGNLATAIEQLEKAVSSSKGSASAVNHAELGQAYRLRYQQNLASADFEKAKTESQRAVELDPGMQLPHTTLAGLYAQNGRTDAAHTEVQEALRLDPRSSEAYNELGALYKLQGRTAEAEPALRKAIDLSPDDWRWHMQLGSFYRDTGEIDPGRKEFEEALRLTPSNVLAMNNLAGVMLRQSRYKEAQATWERAIALDPRFRPAYSGLGAALMLQGEFAQAGAAFRKAIELNSKSYTAWGNLGSASAWSPGGKAEAQKAYLQAIQIAEQQRLQTPKEPQLLASLGGYYASVGDAAHAVPLLRQAVALNPDSPQVTYTTGESYEILHRRDDALNWINRAITLGYSLEYIKRSPELAALRSDPRFHPPENPTAPPPVNTVH
jgi:Flp pilus assembly protein TadD/tRNA A-37 threonylcarbamoyl transferase component Bud32